MARVSDEGCLVPDGPPEPVRVAVVDPNGGPSADPNVAKLQAAIGAIGSAPGRPVVKQNCALTLAMALTYAGIGVGVILCLVCVRCVWKRNPSLRPHAMRTTVKVMRSVPRAERMKDEGGSRFSVTNFVRAHSTLVALLFALAIVGALAAIIAPNVAR